MPAAECAFPPTGASVRAARGFLADQLERWGIAEHAWSAQQALSELATNSVIHAGTLFTVTVDLLADGVLRLEVRDGMSRAPRERHYGPEATTGRGVGLVAMLSRGWGVRPEPDGKTVWCELDLRPGGGRGEPDLDAFPVDDVARDPAPSAADGAEPPTRNADVRAAPMTPPSYRAWRDVVARSGRAA